MLEFLHKMIIKRFEDTDYSRLVTLWDNWSLPHTPITWIPKDTFLVEIDQKLVCSGSLYQLGNTPMFWAEGIISNKEIDKNIRKEGLDLLINHLFLIAKAQGADIVISSTPRDSLKDIFLSKGFSPAPEKYHHIARFE